MIRRIPLRRTVGVGLSLRKVGLKRTATLQNHRNPDPVTHQVRAEVIARDLRIANGCVAPHLDAMAGECRDKWHHLGGWATSHRPLLRDYLAKVEHG